jgi:hypothetical protein
MPTDPTGQRVSEPKDLSEFPICEYCFCSLCRVANGWADVTAIDNITVCPKNAAPFSPHEPAGAVAVPPAPPETEIQTELGYWLARCEVLENALRKLERLIVELYPGHVEPDEEHLEEYRAVWSAVYDARAVLEGKRA